jgi:Icc-related predicted phosphoesterase
MRLFFATDLHGSEVCYRKFLNSWKYYEVSALVLGGDVTGKMVVPIIERDGIYQAKIYGSTYVANSADELEDLKRKIRDMSGYPYLTTEEEDAKLHDKPEKIEELFRRLSMEAFKDWLDLAEEKLKGTSIKLYVTGGNDDPFEMSDILRKHESDVVIAAEDKVLKLGSEYEMISLGYSNKTPWNLPRDITEEELQSKIEGMATSVHDMKRAIFNLHVPPYDTPPIDYAPQLDETLKPRLTAGATFKMIPVGSTAVRHAIEKFQPLLGLHGHIHESRGAVYIKKTLCINPGSEYGEGVLRGVIVKLSGTNKPYYTFTSG